MPQTDGVIISDLSSIAGIGYREVRRVETDDGLIGVPTKMGGPGAPDDLSLAPVTQVWLAVSDDPAAGVSGEYFYHQKQKPAHPAARDVTVQDRLLRCCAELTGVELPPA